MPLLRGPYNARPPAGAAPPFWGPSPQAGGLRITSKKSAIFSHFRCPSFSKILSRYIPFADVLAGRGDFVRQVALNVVMTMPFGFLFPLTRTGDGRFGRTVLACLCVSLGIELLQPLINGTRSSDVTDIITNTAGGVIGFGLYLLFRPVTGWILGRLRAGKQGDGP